MSTCTSNVYLLRTASASGAQEEDAIEELVNEFERFLRALDNGQAAPTPPLPPPDTKAVPVANEPWCVASLARDALSRLVASKDDEFYRKIHFPLYGCCLLVSAVEQVADAGEERAVSLLLLGLDKWEFRIHDTYTQLEQISHCKDSQLLSVGSISGSKMCDCVLRKFYELLEKSEKKTKTDRSATHGAGSGNQKTPAFILTLLRAALQDPSGAETFAGSPQGGFTDVGMHTGTRARGTVWPLARAYLRYILENLTGPSVQCAPLESAQVRLLLGLFHLHAAEEALRVSAPAVGSTSTYLAKHAVDETMGMLGAAARDAAGLCGEGYQSFFDWQDFERRKIHVKSELYGRAQQCRDVATYLFALPGAEPDASSAGRLVQIVLPLQGNTAADEALNLQQRRAVAKVNLGDIKLLDEHNATISKLLTWMSEVEKMPSFATSAIQQQLVMNTVESCFNTAVISLQDTGDANVLWPPNRKVDDSSCVLEKVVYSYAQVASNFRKNPKYTAEGARMRSDLRSRELLLVWTAYCLLHAAGSKSVNTLAGYGVALDWHDLQHLVLPSEAGTRAALAVAAYLKQHSVPGRELFSLANTAPTLAFADAMAPLLPSVPATLNQVRAGDENVKVSHWLQVQEQRRICADLRQQIAAVQERLDCEISERAAYRRYGGGRSSSEELGRLRTEMNRLEANLKQALIPPAPVYCLLPTEDVHARRVLYLLLMQDFLQRLALLASLAQQLLLPQEFLFASQCAPQKERHLVQLLQEKTKFNAGQFDWKSYTSVRKGFGSGSVSVVPASLKDKFSLLALVGIPEPKNVNPSSVDSMFDISSGVWNPDNQSPFLAWTGGQYPHNLKYASGYFNPFISTQLNYSEEVGRLVAFDFADPLPAAPSLNWAIPQLGYAHTNKARGNRGIAEHGSGLVGPVTWLNKPAYLEFCALRAFPRQQLRKVCVALEGSWLRLPLQEGAVQSLLRQALYHLGELSAGEAGAGGAVFATWKQDQMEGDGLQMLAQELLALSGRLRHTPKDHDQLPIVAEIAAYGAQWGGQWSASCRESARELSLSAYAWAEEIDQRVANDVSGDCASKLQDRRTQCLFYLYTVLGHAGGKLRADDAELVLAAMLQSANIRLMDTQPTKADEAIARIFVHVQHILSSRAVEIIGLLGASSAAITRAVRKVLHSAPTDLRWLRLDKGCCFEAVFGADQCLYSVNVLTGSLLVDGLALKRLPESVRAHTLFRRCFNESIFEVQVGAGQKFTTTRPIRGFYYSFQQRTNGRLIIEETPQWASAESATAGDSRKTLQLLDGTEQGCTWSADLPVRLVALHSHWINCERNVIVLRQQSYLERSVQFLMQSCDEEEEYVKVEVAVNEKDKEEERESWKCYRIPTLAAAKPPLWWELCEDTSSFDHLRSVPSGDSVLRVLEKFEDLRYIHVYRTPSMDLKYHLPRFDLEFQWRCEEMSGHDGRIHSLNFCAERLHTVQCLQAEVLPSLHRYLVLTDDCKVQQTLRVLIPKGQVREGGGSGVDVVGSDGIDVVRGYYSYELHPRFQQLIAPSIAARLHLAALHAASSSLLPLRMCAKTEYEIAITLVRQSWVNRPLSEEELYALQQVVGLSFGCATLRLLCSELHMSSEKLSSPGTSPSSVFPDPADAMTQYWQHAKSEHFRNFNFSLRRSEQQRLTSGTYLPSGQGPPMPANLQQQRYEKFDAWGRRFVENTEEELVGWTAEDTSVLEEVPFPLDCSAPALHTVIGQKLLGGLQESWHFHQQQRDFRLQVGLTYCAKRLETMHTLASSYRGEVERYLLRGVTLVKGETDRELAVFRLLRVVNDAPTAGISDLCRLLLDPAVLRSLNPFLASDALPIVAADVRLWLKLCVLEDKLVRLRRLCAARLAHRETSDARLVQELRVYRTWDADAHPQWLLFEAEGRIQIRPLQAAFAIFLLHNPRAITQLNMGEGKTRVILPMLMLHWAASGSQSVLRLHFLTQLLNEAYDHLHLKLTASVHEMKLLLLPFHREMDLTAAGAFRMLQTLREAVEERSCLLVAPEHRLSLELKWYESSLAKEVDQLLCDQLQRIYDMPYRDILDEIDELLRYKFQLIYSTGAKLDLPAARSRYAAAAALLDSLQTCDKVLGILQRDNVSLSDAAPGVGAEAGAFRSVRLIPGPHLEAALPELVGAMYDAVVRDPPHELLWLCSPHLQSIAGVMRRFAVDAHYTLEAFQLDCGGVIPRGSQRLDDLLALRGSLTHGVLMHSLQQRPRVTYGVKRFNARKRIAVPFRAHDTPSDRSEFGHPDTAVALTLLSYYYDRLGESEVQEALKALLQQNPSAQEAIYNSWFALSAPMMGDEVGGLDCVRKIDLSNRGQLALLEKYYRSNRKTVNFWLKQCVFPSEMQQFSSKLIANAWHLAQNSRQDIVGVSGTNDTQLIYPQQVEQRTNPDAPELTATNGKMLKVLTSDTVRYYPLLAHEHGKTGIPVLDLCLELGAAVLLDAGAVCSQLTNEGVAEAILPHLSSQFSAVAYFDTDTRKTWVVRDARGRCWNLHSSPVRESECFVYIDEVRCRGTDMKLRPNALGVLSLGLGMTKDKLMQAAARMRMLAMGLQSVHLAGAEDVTALICQAPTPALASSDITNRHVMEWVVQNTVAHTQHGLKEWHAQGQYFSCTNRNPRLANIGDAQQLDVMYGGGVQRQLVSKIHQTARQFEAHSVTESVLAELAIMAEHVVHYGSDCYALTSQADEECERELEKEVEQEEEREPELPAMKPREESDWNIATAFIADPSCASVAALGGFLPLQGFLQAHCSEWLQLARIPWESVPIVYCTANFAHTLQSGAGQSLEHHLRPADAALYYPATQSLLLLSEREADEALRLTWAPALGGAQAVFLNFTYACTVVSSATTATTAALMPPTPPTVPSSPIVGCRSCAPPVNLRATAAAATRLPQSTQAAVGLFNGQVTFPAPGVRGALQKLLADRVSQKAALHFPGLRGCQLLLPISHLEDACRESSENETVVA